MAQSLIEGFTIFKQRRRRPGSRDFIKQDLPAICQIHKLWLAAHERQKEGQHSDKSKQAIKYPKCWTQEKKKSSKKHQEPVFPMMQDYLFDPPTHHLCLVNPLLLFLRSIFHTYSLYCRLSVINLYSLRAEAKITQPFLNCSPRENIKINTRGKQSTWDEGKTSPLGEP